MSSNGVVDLRNKKATGHSRPSNQTPAPKRKSSLRTRRRKGRALIALGILIFLALGAWGVSYASYMPRFSVQSVEVVGAKKMDAGEVQHVVESSIFDGPRAFLSRMNIFLYPRKDIEAAIVASFPRIRTASISRESLLAQALTVTIDERDAYGLWCSAVGECYLMDETGYIFASASSSGETLPYTFTGNIVAASPIGETYLSSRLASVEAFLQRLGQAGHEPVRVHAESAQDYSILLASGYSLKVSFGGNVDALARDLQLILSSPDLRGKESEIEYIDLRFGNRVYYKLKGEVEHSTE